MAADQPGYHCHAECVEESQAYRPGVDCREFADASDRRLEAPLSHEAIPQERFPEPVEFVGATTPGEQLDPDLGLEHRDGPADR